MRFIWALVIPLAGCVLSPADPGRTYRADWNHLAAGPAWSAAVAQAFWEPDAALRRAFANDATEYCPNSGEFDDEAALDFYVALLSAMARYESGFDPTTAYTESFEDDLGNTVVSRGLLQLSLRSVNRGYACDLVDENALHDPVKNLQCGVKVMGKLIGQDGYIGAQIDGKWKGAARYWSVLRPTHPKNAAIRSYMQNLPQCQV